MRSILQWLLRWCSKKILKKYKPEVIAITGSVGKTSTREAIFAALSGKFRVRQAIRSYNDQVGVPMTIIGMESPGKSLTGWVNVFGRCVQLMWKKDPKYPEMLIVEMGADRPGDIQYLTEFCPPKVGVLTAISPAHVEHFKTIERVAKEKSILVTCLADTSCAVLNSDDEKVVSLKPRLKSHVYTFGFDGGAQIKGSEVVISYGSQSEPNGINFKIEHGGAVVPLFLPGVLGRQHVYPGLAAVAVGLFYGMNLVELGESLAQYSAAPGRMHIVPGIKGCTIIDDTYNSSPRAAHMALETMIDIELTGTAERYAVLGDMLELGSLTEDEHAKLGARVAELGVDFLVTVGEAAKHIASGALDSGMEEHRIAKFGESVSAGKFVQEKIKKGDVILIKGSQGVRMEKIVKEIMGEPLHAKTVLVRQYGKWLSS